MKPTKLYVDADGNAKGVVKPDVVGDTRPPGLGWKIVDVFTAEDIKAMFEYAERMCDHNALKKTCGHCLHEAMQHRLDGSI